MDEQLRAIAHPLRRDILRRVWSRELTAGELAEGFAVTRPAVSQHLRVLTDAGLLSVRRDRTRRLYRADLEQIAALRQGLDAFWSVGLARLKEVVERDRAEGTR